MISQSVSLDLALNHISHVYGILTPADVIPFAAQDPHGGYHADYDDGFPSGSLWRVEGQFLYALIRALRSASVLELGTWHGASATHIAQALQDNSYGDLDCVDNRAYGDIVIGNMIPDHLRNNHLQLHARSLEAYIEEYVAYNHRYDFIFEDAMHTIEQVECVWGAADKLLNPGGMIISHDAMHPIAGPVVREGIARAGYEIGYGAHTVATVLIEPADCGFAVWRKPL